MNEQLKQAVDYFNHIILNDMDKMNCNVWIAGGAVRDYFSIGHPTSDIDMYFPDDVNFDIANAWFSEAGKKLFSNDRLVSYMYNKHRYELIKIHFSSPKETIDAFDFTVCCAAIDKDSVYMHDTFFIDLARRRLVINKLPYPLSTLQRMQKYIKKGFTICNGGIIQIAKALGEIDFNDPKNNHIEKYPDGTPKFVRLD